MYYITQQVEHSKIFTDDRRFPRDVLNIYNSKKKFILYTIRQTNHRIWYDICRFHSSSEPEVIEIQPATVKYVYCSISVTVDYNEFRSSNVRNYKPSVANHTSMESIV